MFVVTSTVFHAGFALSTLEYNWSIANDYCNDTFGTELATIENFEIDTGIQYVCEVQTCVSMLFTFHFPIK